MKGLYQIILEDSEEKKSYGKQILLFLITLVNTLEVNGFCIYEFLKEQGISVEGVEAFVKLLVGHTLMNFS